MWPDLEWAASFDGICEAAFFMLGMYEIGNRANKSPSVRLLARHLAFGILPHFFLKTWLDSMLQRNLPLGG